MLNFALLLAALFIPSSVAHAAGKNTAGDMQACRARQASTAQQAEQFKGEERMKRLIEADLRRASREETEGDADECLEALDHAAKLLAGDV